MPRPMPLVIRVANYTQKFSKYFEQEIENGSSTTTQCWKKSTLSQSFLSVVCVFKHCASSRLVKKKNIAQSKAMKMQKTRQQNDTLVAPFFTARTIWLNGMMNGSFYSVLYDLFHYNLSISATHNY